jgi:pimeloyl-ACP methyl ester carboxylesterase
MKRRLALSLAVFAVLSSIHPVLCAHAAIPIAAPASDRILVTVKGEGPDVILIPGLASSAHVWDATVAHLAATHRVHAVQVAGFAGTDAGSNATGPVAEPVVEAIHAYIAANHLEGAAVIGHSLGGLMAMKLAIAHPADVGRLMIVDALPYAGMMFGPNVTPAMVAPQALGMRNRLIEGTQEEFAAAEPMQMARLIRSQTAQAKAAAAAAAASDHRVVGQALYDDMIMDLRPDLARIKVPVTMLYPWAEGSGMPQQVVDGLYTGAFAPLPQAKVERIDDSAHFIMIDQLELFLQKVDAFLAG